MGVYNFKWANAILTFLSFAVAFVLQDKDFENLKETKMLQKNFELAFSKVKNYKI